MYFLDFEKKLGISMAETDWKSQRLLEISLTELSDPIYLVSYCTNEGLIPGVMRIKDDYIEFFPSIPNPFEGCLCLC